MQGVVSSALHNTSQTLPTASRTCVFRRWVSRSSSHTCTLAAATSAMVMSGAGTSWKGRSAGSLCFQKFGNLSATLRFPGDRDASLSHEERRQRGASWQRQVKDRAVINEMHGGDRGVIDVLVCLQLP